MTPGQKISNSDRKSFIKAIDDLFLKLELSYHYQFYKVFGTDHRLTEAKKLWAESLKKYPTESINAAVETVIQSNDYLPTLTEILKACSGSMGEINIPSPQEAFIEAQKSSAPRQEFSWTHPIIYWTGKEIGWDLINSPNNTNTFQAFSKTYMRLAKEIRAGKKFDLAPTETSDAIEPIDVELLERLRKKHGL
ncbi:MAG: replication protein P [Gammaproteobacteria bacterium]|nr:MAG: hypothetical protein CBD96_004150 [Gammaproteobacteria bacterium TMED236]|tara:strand:- start:1301 stop:1879 length:579 start_codon:yes stop_codon:yes gene_type:complete